MSRWLAIVNRCSGGIIARQHLRGILPNLGQWVEKTVFTEYPGHASELAMGAASYSGLAAVGGDGTIFEILKGLDRKRQRLAIIPTGRGNSLARDLGLLSQLPSLEVLDSREPSYIDLMEVTVKNADGLELRNLSASTVALGYPVAVAKAGLRLRRMGKFCYAAGAPWVRPAPFAIEVSCEAGGTVKKQLTGFIANNTRHMANFRVFPRASYRDGFFDLMELNAGILKQNLHNLSALFGSHFYIPFEPIRTKSVQVRLHQPQELMIDGEFYPRVVSVNVQILAAALACNGGKSPR